MSPTPANDGPPTAPEPDAKDWTWVIESACPECGFDASKVDPTAVAGMIRANAKEWEQILANDEALVRTRPTPTTWSAAEYAAHVRDVFAKFHGRLHRMRTEDGPHYENWDQDATAIAERYDLQLPKDIGPALHGNAIALADEFDLVTGEEWKRTGFRGDGARFTIATFAQYLIHDPVHHVHDAIAGMVAIRARR